MRTIQLLIAMSTACMMFIACNQDSIVDQDIRPDVKALTADLPVEQTIEFVSWQTVEIAPPACPLTMTAFSEDSGDDKPDRIAGCMGEYGFEGEGTGYLEGIDRFYVQTTIKFNPTTQTFLGMIQYDFASSESTLTLMIEGPANSYHRTDGGLEIHVPVRFYSGSGIFENLDFQGVLKIMNADEIFDAQNTSYEATLLVQGKIIAF